MDGCGGAGQAGTSGSPVTSAEPSGRRRRRRSSIAVAAAAVSTTWPAAASDSAAAVADAAGPETSSSRCRAGSPTRKNVKVPLWIPTDIRSRTRPADVSTSPSTRSAARIRSAARAALAAWPSPSYSSRTASPPHLTRPAPSSYAIASSPLKTALSVSLISSAPTRPLRASRSVSAVKPEMSTKASDPETSRTRVWGVVRSQSTTSRGTYGRSAAWSSPAGTAPTAASGAP